MSYIVFTTNTMINYMSYNNKNNSYTLLLSMNAKRGAISPKFVVLLNFIPDFINNQLFC